jgi:hypothetical protein
VRAVPPAIETSLIAQPDDSACQRRRVTWRPQKINVAKLRFFSAALSSPTQPVTLPLPFSCSAAPCSPPTQSPPAPSTASVRAPRPVPELPPYPSQIRPLALRLPRAAPDPLAVLHRPAGIDAAGRRGSAAQHAPSRRPGNDALRRFGRRGGVG